MKNIADIFGNWNETIIWSCLQGVMGEVCTVSSNDAAMAILGDFAFYAGKPSEQLIRFKPESCTQDFIIMVPQNDEWGRLIEKCYGNNAKKVFRYAIKKEKDIFDENKLQQAVAQILLLFLLFSVLISTFCIIKITSLKRRKFSFCITCLIGVIYFKFCM